jgi:hypothetical protein
VSAYKTGMELFDRLRRKARLIREVARSPRLTVDAFGDAASQKMFEDFNARHPRLPLIRFKSFGVMLRDLKAAEAELFRPKSMPYLLRQVRKAEKAGFSGRTFLPAERMAEIMQVNSSSAERQGRPMEPHFTDEAAVWAYSQTPGIWYGIFDKRDVLRAYCDLPVGGDYYVYSRILGDARFLGDGIMYLLMRDTMQMMNRQLHEHGHPRWAVYDTYIGGSDGLREFKRRTGFSPYRVTWRWLDK